MKYITQTIWTTNHLSFLNSNRDEYSLVKTREDETVVSEEENGLNQCYI